MRNSPAGDVDYDAVGAGYAVRRRADPRIESQVHAALGDAQRVLNVGAGAGSYEPAGREVLAVEPSAVMRAQRPVGSAPVIDAVAEALPLEDQSFDAGMAMLTVHQWRDLEKGLAELCRVVRGPIVILTFDGDAFDRFWLADYAPQMMHADRQRVPAISTLARLLGGRIRVDEVPIPIDCTDGFTEAFYARPEMFLKDDVRASQSVWRFISAAAQERTVSTLREDLASGLWDAKYGHWRAMPEFRGALRLVVSTNRGR